MHGFMVIVFSCKVYDGTNDEGDLIATYCGSVAPLDISTTSNIMYVQFFSDNSDSGRGFNATYITECKIILTERSGSFQPLDKDHDGLYDDIQNCTWIITANPEESIQLNISDIDIDETAKTNYDSCITDYIKVCLIFNVVSYESQHVPSVGTFPNITAHIYPNYSKT